MPQQQIDINQLIKQKQTLLLLQLYFHKQLQNLP
jgi:hypothetical protein